MILRAMKEKWSFRENHALLRAEGIAMLKHSVEERIGYKARSRCLDSREVCRKPSRTCNQALDLESWTHISDIWSLLCLITSCHEELSISLSSSFSY